MTNTVRAVAIDPTRFDNPIHQGLDTLARLREAGIPATGVLYVAGVERGSLTISEPDIVDGEVTYSWCDAP